MGLFRWLKKKPKRTTQEPVDAKQERHVKTDETAAKDVEDKAVAQSIKGDKSETKNRYHVSQNKDESSPHYKEWRVRKEGSDKTIQYFSTQKKAIEDAEKRAKKLGGSIVIHKVDGTIRKQKYS